MNLPFAREMCTYSENKLLKYLQTTYFQHIFQCTLAMKWAVIRGHFRVVELLIKKGASTDMFDVKFVATSGGTKELLELMSSRLRKSSHQKFSFQNVKYEWSGVLDNNRYFRRLRAWLFEKGFDPDYVPLYLVIRGGNEGLIELMLEYGAAPCKPLYPEGVLWTPLKEAFSLPMSTIEKIIKYAALQVKFETEGDVNKFLAHFKGHKARSFKEFAVRCVAEVKTMKNQTVTSSCETLFSFIIMCGEFFHEFTEMKKNVLYTVTSISLPIYLPIISKKLGRKFILDALLSLSPFRWSWNSNEVPLSYVCVINILSFLSEEDLVCLWIALQ